MVNTVNNKGGQASVNEAERVSKLFFKRLEREPLDVQHAITRFLPNLINACNWSFVPKVEEGTHGYKELKESLEVLNKSNWVEVIPLRNGYLLTASLDTLMGIASRVAPEIFSNEEKEVAVAFRQKSVENFIKFLRSGVSEARIGIYNLNDSPNITINGRIFKAFALDLANVAMYLNSAGYDLVIEGRRLPSSYALIPEKYNQILQRLEMSPSQNGLMLDIVKVG